MTVFLRIYRCSQQKKARKQNHDEERQFITMNKRNEYDDKQLQAVVGGICQSGYKYSFRPGDWVNTYEQGGERYIMTDYLDTNDGNQIVHAISTEVKYDTSDRNENIIMTADAFYYHYTQFGGCLQAMG